MKMTAFVCPICQKQFTRPSGYVKYNLEKSSQRVWCCSKACSNKNQLKYPAFSTCLYCQTLFVPHERRCAKFCSQSHAALYNNAHKTKGYRRSKLEIYLEAMIKKEFPNLNLVCNNRQLLGFELDFYFPDLKFAIELNGIVHYEPIYGSDKLTRVQDNDKQKMIRCYEQGIELMVIDISMHHHCTQKVKDKYWKIISDILINKFSPQSRIRT